MEVILSQSVQLKTLRNGWTTLTKSFESNVIPHKGDFIEDTVWKADDEQEVQSVIINYQKKFCYVNLPVIVLNTEDEAILTEYEDMAKLHGWSTTSERLALQ